MAREPCGGSVSSSLAALLILLLAGSLSAESVIEEVNDRQLEKLVDDNDFVAVAWVSKSCK